MTYQTCKGCANSSGDCAIRDAVKKQLKGLSVTSIKWRCKEKTPIYQVGDPVWVSLSTSESDEWGSQYYAFFPGIVVQNKFPKFVIYVQPSSESECEMYTFEPNGNGTGYVKQSHIHMKKRAGDTQTVCTTCGGLPDVNGHHIEFSCHPDFPPQVGWH